MGDEKTIDNVLAMHAQAVEMIRWRDAEIAALKTNLDAWQSTGNAIMLCAVGREAPLSDSDVCGEINALRQQVAELQAWKANVPVKALNRMMTVAPFDSVEADIVWKWLKFSR